MSIFSAFSGDWLSKQTDDLVAKTVPSGALPPANGRPQYAQRMLQNWDLWEASLSDEKRQTVQDALRAYPDQNQGKKDMAIDQYLLETHPEQDAYTVLKNREVYMGGIAAKEGWEGAGSDPATFYENIRQRITKRADESVMLRGHSDADPVNVIERVKSRQDSLATSGYTAGAEYDPGDELTNADTAEIDAFSKWNQTARTHAGFSGEKAGEYFERFHEQFQRGQKDKTIAIEAAKAIFPIVQSAADAGADMRKVLPYLKGLDDTQLALTQEYLEVIKKRSGQQGTAEYLTSGGPDVEFAKAHPKEALDAITTKMDPLASAPFIGGARVQRRYWQSAIEGWKENADVRHYTAEPGGVMNSEDYGPLLAEMKAAGVDTGEVKDNKGRAWEDGKFGILSPEQAKFHNQRHESYESDKELIERLKDISTGKLDPLAKDTIWQKATVGLGEALPLIAYTATPLGLPIRFTAYTFDAKNKLIQGGVARKDAETIAPFVGGAQAAMDVASLTYLTKMPFVDKILKNVTNGLARWGMHTVGTLASQEAIQLTRNHLTEALAQDVFAAAKSYLDPASKVTHTQWNQVYEEMKHAAPETLYSMLLLVPISGGIAHFKDIKGADHVVRNPEALHLMGFEPEAVGRIMDAPEGRATDVFEQEDYSRKQNVRITPRDDSQRTTAELKTGEADPAREELTTESEQALNDEAGVRQFFQDDQGWHIQNEDGTITDTGDSHTGTVIREKMADQNLDKAVEDRLRQENEGAMERARESIQEDEPSLFPEQEPVVAKDATTEGHGEEITVYRAGDPTETGIKPWASFSRERDTAGAYIDNPGYGGPHLREEKVQVSRILEADTRGRKGMADLAEALGFEREKGEEWFDNGWRYPWEESKKIKDAAQEKGFDAIEYVDDFPENGKTIVFTRDPRQSKPPGDSATTQASPTAEPAEGSGAAPGESLSEKDAPVSDSQTGKPADSTATTKARKVPLTPAESAPPFTPSGGQRPIKESAPKSRAKKEKSAPAPEKSRFGPKYDALEAELAALPPVKGKSVLEEVRRLREKGVEKFAGKTGRIVKKMQEIERDAEGVHSWTSATEDSVAESAEAIVDRVVSKEEAGETVAKELDDLTRHSGLPFSKVFKDRKMSQLDKATVMRGGKLQKSADEARRAEAEIRKVLKSPERQGYVSVWMEAAGDKSVLQFWEANAKQKWMKELAKGAQTLTAAEIAVAQKSRQAFDILGNRGKKHDVLGAYRDNYVPHVWDDGSGPMKGGTKTLKENFAHSKARTFATFFDGDQAGFVPKQTAIGNLMAGYIVEMNRVIADRQFVKDLSSRKGSDGRPLVVPAGIMQKIEPGEDGSGGEVYLVMPKIKTKVKDAAGDEIDTSDYKPFKSPQPALSGWRWIGADKEGNPIMLKADLLLHPEAMARLTATLGKSEFREWMTSGGKAAIPKMLLRGLDKAQSELKAMMFSGLSPFHAVQEGTHAIGHRINPFFNIPKIDLRDRGQARAASLGLKLVHDGTTEAQYIEGVGSHSPWLLDVAKKYGGPAGRLLSGLNEGFQKWLFERYIPGLKYKTFEAMEARNRSLYKEELAKGEITADDIGILSAEQSNAAYGHLNYELLDRNPTMQHIMQLGLLAPDFLEARARFVGQAIKGLTGSKVGAEQLHAVVFLALSQLGAAWAISAAIGDKWDPLHPFEVRHGGRRYFMRSVPEDIFRLAEDTYNQITGRDAGNQFVSGRINPLLEKLWQMKSGINYRGEKVSLKDTLGELAASYIPISLRYAPGLRDLTETTRNSPTTPLEQLWGSIGLRISRYSPISETYKGAKKWMEDVKKLDTDKGSYPVSEYQQLRYALEDGDMERAAGEYEKLTKEKTPDKISKGFKASVEHSFTESKKMDKEYADSLKGYDRELYDLAVSKRKEILEKFGKLKTAK